MFDRPCPSASTGSSRATARRRPRIHNMATAEQTKKRKLPDDDDKKARKKQKKQQKKAREDEGDLDTDAGLNRAFERMDGELLADHVAQKTRRFGTDLSAVELSDLYVSGE